MASVSSGMMGVSSPRGSLTGSGLLTVKVNAILLGSKTFKCQICILYKSVHSRNVNSSLNFLKLTINFTLIKHFLQFVNLSNSNKFIHPNGKNLCSSELMTFK